MHTIVSKNLVWQEDSFSQSYVAPVANALKLYMHCILSNMTVFSRNISYLILSYLTSWFYTCELGQNPPHPLLLIKVKKSCFFHQTFHGSLWQRVYMLVWYLGTGSKPSTTPFSAFLRPVSGVHKDFITRSIRPHLLYYSCLYSTNLFKLCVHKGSSNLDPLFVCRPLSLYNCVDEFPPSYWRWEMNVKLPPPILYNDAFFLQKAKKKC